MQRQLGKLAEKRSKRSNHLRAPKPWSNRHMLYDGTLLRILQSNKLAGADIFPDLFRRNPTERVLDFLNGDTNLPTELQLMSTTDIPVFARSFMKELIRS